jgi:hypothetical protein
MPALAGVDIELRVRRDRVERGEPLIEDDEVRVLARRRAPRPPLGGLFVPADPVC